MYAQVIDRNAALIGAVLNDLEACDGVVCMTVAVRLGVWCW